MKIIGIEFTFDDLSISCVENGRKIHSLVTINTSNHLYQEFGGVIPNLNLEYGKKSVKKLLELFQLEHGFNFTDIDMISYSAKPGFKSTIAIARSIAKKLGEVLNLYVMPIDHLEAHFFSVYINKNITEFKDVLYLIISGGNTKLYRYIDGKFNVIIETKDIAIGDMLDKLARKLNFQHAKDMDSIKCDNFIDIKLPDIRFKDKKHAFSFSGLQTFFEKWINENNYPDNEKGGAIFKATFNYLLKTIKRYTDNSEQKIVISGGVAASKHLQYMLLHSKDMNRIFLPCTSIIPDNGAMIASAAYFANFNNE